MPGCAPQTQLPTLFERNAALCKRILLTLLCILGLSVNGVLMFPVLPYIVHGDNDFMGFYAGAVLAGSSDLYKLDAATRVEARYWEHPRAIAFVRLPFYAALISPLRYFSYQRAYWIWQSISLAAVAMFVCVWPARNKWLTAVACCWSLSLLNCFIMGQDVTMVMLALAVSLAALFRGRHFAAGCLFSICAIKYNLFLAIPLLIIKKRAWKFAGGLATGGLVLLAISFASGGWSWPRQYLAILRLPTTTPYYAGLPNLHGLFYHQPHSLLMESVTACLVVLAAWLAMSGKEIRHAIAAALASGMLLSYHAFFADSFMMVAVGLLLLDRVEDRLYKLVAIALLCPLTFLPFIAPTPFFHPAIVFLAALLLMAVRESRKEYFAESEVLPQPQAIASA
jgi:hypothetical protein